MKAIGKSLITVLVTLLMFQPVLSWAGQGARVIPQGKVSILADGKEVGQFQSEMPLPEGSLMVCKGSCLVQTQNIQLVAQDLAVFALSEGKARWDLIVKSGQVDFAMKNGAKPISFHTPYDSIQADRAIVPATNAAMVRGSLAVNETEAVLAIHEGTLQVMDADGTQLVQPGQSIRLAQTQMTPQQAKEKEEADKKKAAAAAPGGTTAGAGAGNVFYANGALTTVGWVTVGVLGAGAIAGIAVAASSGGGTTAVSGQ
jgi:hypothetical protein